MAIIGREDKLGNLIALVLLAALLVAIVIGTYEREALEKDLAIANEDVQTALTLTAALAVQVEELGGKPIVDPGDLKGPAGERGLSGATGRDGDDGDPGPPGPPGPSGPAGSSGADGAGGATGSPGPSGNDGSPGPPGPTGPSGATGATGPQGAQGPQGPQGPAGQDGVSVSTFTFTYDLTTYECSDPEGDGSFSCEPI